MLTKMNFPGGPVFKNLPSNVDGAGLTPGQGTKIPHAFCPKTQIKTRRNIVNKLNKNIKNGPYQKKKKKS